MRSESDCFAEALSHHRAGRLREACELYEQALAANGQHLDSLHNLSAIMLGLGDAPRAEGLASRALAIRPEAPLVQLQHARCLRALHRADAALVALSRALAIDPTLVEAHHLAGNLLKATGRYAEAIVALGHATRLAPADAAAWLNLGVAYLGLEAVDDAIAAFKKAVTLEPHRAEAHNVLGHALLKADRVTDAELAFQEALRLQPNYADPHDNLGCLYRGSGRVAEAIVHFRKALVLRPSASTHSNLLFALNFSAQFSPAEIFAEHMRWNLTYASALCPTVATPRILRNRRLRVGYISPDFCHHAVAYFIEPILACHDRQRFEVFCYASVARPDRFTHRIKKSVEHWRDIARLDDQSASNLVQSDELDLLIDLAGHSAGNRLLVMARRPAPVQATWIGYPNTTGLAAVDYRLTDAISDPPGMTENLHTERLVRLPASFSCYRPDDNAPPTNDLPAAHRGYVTFASFNQFAKVTPEVIALWARVLQGSPNSRLLLKSRGLGDSEAIRRVRTTFGAHGVEAERVILKAEQLPVALHLGLYHGVDVALDPFPYNGTTTTLEALWMGVPLVTMAGATHVSRVGASLLTHLGLTECIAQSADDYVARALQLERDRPRLAELRRTLRDRMRRSPLIDATGFTRNLEAAFLKMAACVA